MKTCRFYISGTHCRSCKIYIESKLKENSFIHDARVDLKKELLEVKTDSDWAPERLAKLLTEQVQSHGYLVSTGKKASEKQHTNAIWTVLPIGLGILAIFFLLQKSGILNIGIGGPVTPFTSFLIGLVASVSTCLAIVGGLVLSLSATISQDNVSDTKTFILFHIGRLVSFAIFGGVLGAIGDVISINLFISTILGILTSVLMLLLGLNLIGVFKGNIFSLPAGLFNFFKKAEHKIFAPLSLGLATFFLPCGFTQTMQVSALSSGSFMSGFFIMLFFALGTLPMLAFLSFGSASFARSKHSLLFFKTAGIVVIGLGLFALLSGLAGLGVINPLFNM